MQALGLVTISKKLNLIEISFDKFLDCKKMGLGLCIYIEKIYKYIVTCMKLLRYLVLLIWW